MSNQSCGPDAAIPFKGLDPYTEDDAALLFGRNEERDRLIYGLQSSRLTVLYGARQVGKTSLLRAAVVNQLRGEARRHRSAPNPPDSAVVVFEDWSGGDVITRLSEAINRELTCVGIAPELLPKASNENFASRCEQWIGALGGQEGGELFLILDHFDHHLMLCPYCDAAPGSFDFEISKVLSTRGLAVNVLFAIRDELLAHLDRYRPTIPGLYNNLFRLEALTRKQAKEAIQSPVYVAYNEKHPDQKIGVEAELVGAVLASIALNRRAGESQAPDSAVKAADERYDAGGLQLAMKAVWEYETRHGSGTLRSATFEQALGGIRGIANAYVDERFAAFERREKYLSARVFDHLLTPGGVGVAYQVADLASRVGVEDAELKALVEKLRSHKMVMASVSGETLGPLYYETAHRVLTPAMLERVQRYHTEKNRKEKELTTDIETALRLFSDTSQVDGLQKIIETSDAWQDGVRNLLVDNELQRTLRGALARMLDDVTQKGQLGGYKGAVSSIAYSRDGKFIMTGAENGAVKLWDLRSPGQLRATGEQKHKTWIWRVRASADGKWFATGSDDGTVALWAANDGALQFSGLVPFGAGASPLVRGLSFSPDGSLLAIAGTDGVVRLWRLREQTLDRQFTCSACAVRCVEFAPDGLSIATGADDGAVGLWDLNGESLLSADEGSRFRHDSAVWGVRFHPDGTRLASCSEDHRIKVWNLAIRDVEHTLGGHSCWVLDLDYNATGTLLASASEDGTARIWDSNGNEVAALVHGAPVNGVCFSPDGLTVATAAADCRVRLWHVGQSRTRRTRKQFRHSKHAILLDVSFSCDGKRLATSGTDSEVRIWDEDGHVRNTLRGHDSWILSVVFHPTLASCLLTGSIDGTARLWNLPETGSRRFTPNDGPVWSVAFSPDGKMFATGSGGGKISAWELSDPAGSPALCFPSDEGSIWSVRFSPDGKWIAAGRQDGSIHIRDLAGKDVMKLRGVHDGQILSLSFSPDGKYLASGSSEGRICLWDLSVQSDLWFHDLDAPIWSVVFSPSGKLLASGSVNRSVYLWSLAHERVGGYSADGPIRGLAFSRTGDWLAGSCSDGTVRLWPIGGDDFASLLTQARKERDAILPFLWPQSTSVAASA